MDYKVIFLKNDEFKEAVLELEMDIAALSAYKDIEFLEYQVSRIIKLEQMLRLDEKEAVGKYLLHLLEKQEVSNVIEVMTERVGLLKELCAEFSCKNKTDEKFCSLYQYILSENVNSLYEHMVSNFTRYFVEDTNNANNLLKSYNRTLYWGALDYWTGNYELIKNRAESLIQNADAMLWMYLSLEDYTSKDIMFRVLHNWITFSHRTLQEMPRNQYDQYFDYDILNGSCGNVFIDAGAYKGDTVAAFVENFKNYQRIYSYEITPDTYEELKNNVALYKNIVCSRCGIADQPGSMYVNVCEDIGGNRLGGEGDIEVPVVTLDNNVSEKIDFIKMDIEGAEYQAILGARNII